MYIPQHHKDGPHLSQSWSTLALSKLELEAKQVQDRFEDIHVPTLCVFVCLYVCGGGTHTEKEREHTNVRPISVGTNVRPGPNVT